MVCLFGRKGDGNDQYRSRHSIIYREIGFFSSKEEGARRANDRPIRGIRYDSWRSRGRNWFVFTVRDRMTNCTSTGRITTHGHVKGVPNCRVDRVLCVGNVGVVEYGCYVTKLERTNGCHFIANYLLPRTSTGFHAWQRMRVRSQAGFGRSRIFIGMAIFAQCNMYCSTSYRHANGLPYRGHVALEHFGCRREALIFHANFKGPHLRRPSIIVICVFCRPICEVPINVCVNSIRGSKGR